MHVNLGGLFHGIGHHGGGGHHFTSHHHGHSGHHNDHSDSSLLSVGLLLTPGIGSSTNADLVLPFNTPSNTILTISSANGQFPVQAFVPKEAARFIYLTELNQFLNDASRVTKGAYPTQYLLLAITLISMAAGAMLYLAIFDHPDVGFTIVLSFIGMIVGFVFSQIAFKYYLRACENSLRVEMRNFIHLHNQRANSQLSHWLVLYLVRIFY